MVSFFWERLWMRIEPVVKPRWTWRYILCCGVASYVAYCTIFSSPLLSSNLPAYTGQYDVGTIDIEVPVESEPINNATFKDGTCAFKLDTVLFTLYYPAMKAAVSTSPQHLWVPRPLSIVGEGYARFAQISNFVTNSIFTFSLWVLVGRTKIPAKVDVPLMKGGELPVMVFSHGMASSRTQYTHYVGELASRGFVIAAIEHRDGSGPGSQVMQHDKPTRTLLHFGAGDLAKDSGINSDEFKQAQLDFRQAEVEETVRVLQRLHSGHGEEVRLSNSRREGRNLKDWADRLVIDNMSMAGHSFGATLALQTMKGGPTRLLPFGGVVALDPGKQSGPLNHDVRVPALILHSNSWSKQHSIFFGRAHFDVVKEIVQSVLDKGMKAWFMTSLGTSHPSVTDAPLIEPWLLSFTTGATINVKEGVHQYVQVTERFLTYQSNGTATGILTECVTHPEYDVQDPDRTGKLRKLFRKYWQIHAAPC